MARSHHRKKHKQHLQHFRHSQDSSALTPAASRSRAAVLFGILGAIVGISVAYFATGGEWIWLLAGAVAGGAAGYLIGRVADRAR